MMVKVFGFIAGMVLASAAQADQFDDYNRWQGQNFDRMEAERVQDQLRQQLDGVRAEQSRQEQLLRANPVDDVARPVYAPYGGYQEPWGHGRSLR
jgi:hypothetical protein